MKIAYCIICHKMSNVLEYTVSKLSKTDYVYIHVDKKVDVNDFKVLAKLPNVEFIKKREDVHWGEFSQIQATLNLFESTRDNDCDYVFLLSGDDIPLFEDQENFKSFLKKNKRKQYIGISLNEHAMQQKIDERLMYNYGNAYFKKNMTLKDRILIKTGIFKTENKLFEQLPKLYKGVNWIGITNEFRDYVFEYLESNSNYIEAFKHSLCGDEIFFHTLVMNSPFKDRVYKCNEPIDDNAKALRYIDWGTGPDYPRTLDLTDFDKINHTNQKCFFARKISHDLSPEDIECFVSNVEK